MKPRAVSFRQALPRDPAIAQIAREWRRLTSGKSARSGRRLGPGERTLIACSGGADSSALVLALAAATDQIVVAHVVHDMRPALEAFADRDAVRSLAEGLGLEFVETAISVYPAAVQPSPGWSDSLPAPDVPRSTRNIERLARERRYEALARLARELGISYIATGHHAQDQLETLLMRLLRGAGPAGLCGIARKRCLTGMDKGKGRDEGEANAVEESRGRRGRLPHEVGEEEKKTSDSERQEWTGRPTRSIRPGGTPGPLFSESPIWLIRPMLDLSRDDAERICLGSDWEWRRDVTNQDSNRLRSALRQRVIPELVKMSPTVECRVAASVDRLRDVARLMKRRAGKMSRYAMIRAADEEVLPQPNAIAWRRERLKGESVVVLGEILKSSAASLSAGHGRDRLGHGATVKMAEAIRDDCRDPRRFMLSGIEVCVTSDRVEMKRIEP